MHDFFRFWWELFALNLRKTVFRGRGGRGRAPCQAPSDSGRALETHCEACVLWNKPERFRRVCPLLQLTPDGWRCSVNAAEVRPFWGRALGYYGGTLAGLYLLATLALFIVMRRADYAVGYLDVAWPPAWRQLDTIRSQRFLAAGQAALAANQINEARLSFALAYNNDPTNYEAGLALAQLRQAGPMPNADPIFAQLLASHPAQAARTTRAWAEALLRHGDFPQLANLALERLEHEAAPTASWAHALIFSARQMHDPARLHQALALTNLPNETRSLLRLEAAALGGDSATVVRILSAPLTANASTYARFYQLQFLLNAGAAPRAWELLAHYGDKLPADERVELSLDVLAQLGGGEEKLRQVTTLMAGNPRPELYEILATHLIRFPDQKLLRLVAAQLATMPWVETAEGLPANAALFCAAGLSGEQEIMVALRARMRRATRMPLLALDGADEFFATPEARTRMGHFAPALPMLPLETLYSLFSPDEPRQRRQPQRESTSPSSNAP